MADALTSLKERLAEVRHLNMAAGVLDWDQQTYMPPRGVRARSEQRATVVKLAHALFTEARVGELLAQAEHAVAGRSPDDDDAALVRVTRRDYDKATKLPSELVAEIARVSSLAHEEWAEARKADDYNRFAPWLERIIGLERQVADAFGYEDRLYDALLDQYEPEMTSARLDQVFAELKAEIIPLARSIAERGNAVDASVLTRDYDEDAQRIFAEGVLRECGFDFQRGRQDRSVHPFCTNFSSDDVRLTTRYDRNFLPMALFGSMHEMGHGLYEQGVAPEYDDSPLGSGASLAVHESQSRLWENLVGRSRGFWGHYYGRLKETFPQSIGDTDLETFYRAINRVSPSLIRVEADEVTYNLHIILRYEMENDLLEGRLSVADAPEAWNTKMRDYLGVTPTTHREGILQDIHWSMVSMGYFPTYSLGNVLSAQLYEKAVADVPAIPSQIARGEFAALLGWLRENVHRHGRKYLPDELIQRATGGPLQTEPYLRYLRTKFGEIYGV